MYGTIRTHLYHDTMPGQLSTRTMTVATGMCIDDEYWSLVWRSGYADPAQDWGTSDDSGAVESMTGSVLNDGETVSYEELVLDESGDAGDGKGAEWTTTFGMSADVMRSETDTDPLGRGMSFEELGLGAGETAEGGGDADMTTALGVVQRGEVSCAPTPSHAAHVGVEACSMRVLYAHGGVSDPAAAKVLMQAFPMCVAFMHIYIYLYIYTYIYTYAYIYIYIYIYTCTCTYIPTYIHINIYIYTHTYIYIYIYIYIYTHTHTYTFIYI